MRHRHGGNPGRSAAPGTGFNALPDQFENGSPILGNHFNPCHLAHHREINAAESDSCEENVNAVAEGLVTQRFDGIRQSLRTISLRPAIIHLSVSFVNSHLQRRMSHSKWNEFLP